MGLYQAIKQLLPQQNCIICTDVSDDIVCKNCQKSFINKPYRCKSCANSIAYAAKNCGQCINKSYNFDNAFAIYEYDEIIAYLVKQMKYKANFAVIRFFSTIIANKVKALISSNDYDVLIPMPLHTKRLKQRGYNQVIELLMQTKQKAIIDTESIIRTKNTKPLASMSLRERNKEIKNAFDSKMPINKAKVLIIDDVLSSCCSVNELAKTIIRDNPKVKQCDVLALARASYSNTIN